MSAFLSSTTSSVITLLLVSGGSCYLYRIWSAAQSALDPLTVFDPAKCKQVLACSGNFYSNQEANPLMPVEARALPNQRLVRAFGIDNAFTTKDDGYRKEFKEKARKLISLPDEEWKNIVRLADKHLQQDIAKRASHTGGNIQLDDMIRSLCLRITLHVFFGRNSLDKLFVRNPVHLGDQVISDITTSINDLWHESKTTSPSRLNKSKLKSALATIFPDIMLPGYCDNLLQGLGRLFSGPKPRQLQDNPLNLILPAYETLWRVVLSCFIEVAFRPGARPEWKDVLRDFLNNPTLQELQNPEPKSDGCTVSVHFIVKEALRLYPSTKSVYRKFRVASEQEPQLIVANIEKCHRTPHLWQPEPNNFKPARWFSVSHESEKSFMPFGAIPFVCPAMGDYGPRIIGVLVAAITAQISSGDWTLELYRAGESIGGALGADEPLIADRKTYTQVQLIRRSS